MIHGSYKLELQCDSPGCAEKGFWPGRIIGYFEGENAGEARKKAREAGWKVRVSRNQAICRGCAGG